MSGEFPTVGIKRKRERITPFALNLALPTWRVPAHHGPAPIPGNLGRPLAPKPPAPQAVTQARGPPPPAAYLKRSWCAPCSKGRGGARRRRSEPAGSLDPRLGSARHARQPGDPDLDPVHPPARSWLGTYCAAAAPCFDACGCFQLPPAPLQGPESSPASAPGSQSSWQMWMELVSLHSWLLEASPGLQGGEQRE